MTKIEALVLLNRACKGNEPGKYGRRRILRALRVIDINFVKARELCGKIQKASEFGEVLDFLRTSGVVSCLWPATTVAPCRCAEHPHDSRELVLDFSDGTCLEVALDCTGDIAHVVQL